MLLKVHAVNGRETSSRPLLYFKKLYLRSKEVVNTLILIYSGRPCLGHTIKTNCTAFQKVDPEICSILIFRQGSVSPPHFVCD